MSIETGDTSKHASEGGAPAERLCYYCVEGNCALCNGRDKTIVDGRIIEVPCAHGCREQQRKPNGKVENDAFKRRRA